MPRENRFLKRVAIPGPVAVPGALAPLVGRWEGDRTLARRVSRILEDVRTRGDAALVDQVRAFDGPCPGPECLRVPVAAIREAWERCPPGLRKSLRRASASIRRFHAGQGPASCRDLRHGGLRAGVRAFPLGSVGLYVPGGRAAYPSTLLMLAIPAQIAGVPRIAVTSPRGPRGLPDGGVLAAAHLLGLSEIYALGGAAAVGALAFGTESVPPVDKILGPGNAFVAEAKRQVFGAAGIDSIAGPTELVVLSDGSSPPAFLAADLLAQAEHDVLAAPVLVTTDAGETSRVERELEIRLEGSPRSAIQRRSLRTRGAAVLCPDRQTACAAADFLAPEHLSVQAAEAEDWAKLVPRAAAVFLGPWTPEAAGDYGAGPNHSLPTGRTARFSSPVGLWDFVRYQSWLEMDRESLGRASAWMLPLAEAEGLAGHAESLRVRGGVP